MDSRVYNYKMSGEPLANSMLGSMELGVGTFALIDTRDQKDYLVRRLADGNCWMVQNLDLELDEFTSDKTARLTPENTDIAETWIPDASVNDKINKTFAEGGYKDKLQAENLSLDFQGLATWLLGSNVQTQQFQNSTQTEWTWGSRRTNDTDAYEDIKNAANAAGSPYVEMPRSYDNTIFGTSNVRFIAMDISTGKTYGTINTSSTTSGWVEGQTITAPTTDDYSPTDKLTTPGMDESTTADDVWNYYGSMYMGHFYNWYAATAESGRYTMEVGARSSEESICPSGWELPRGTFYASNKSGKSWYNLIISTYGTEVVEDNGDSDTDNAKKSRKTPLSLTLSGYYTWSGGQPYAKGHQFNMWATGWTGGGSSEAYSNTTYGRVRPEHSYYQAFGNTIRCVSRGTENQVTPPEDVVQSTCAANSICYDANGGTGDTMANTGSATFGSSKVLSAPTYTRTGYAFVGWSESKDAVQSGAYIYGPNETITVPNLSSEGMTLYAQWLAPENSSYTMQAFGRNETVKTCSNMTDGNNGTTEERIALRDERDDNVYIVTKLKDGNCWMTSNLALNLADFAGKTTGTLLTPDNTDLTASREDLSTLTIEGVGNEQQTVKYWDPSKSSVDEARNIIKTSIQASIADPETTSQYATAEQIATLDTDAKIEAYITDYLDSHNYFEIVSESLTGTAQSVQFMTDNDPPATWEHATAFAARPRAKRFYNSNVPQGYYNRYARDAELDSGDDSLCPSGWQLPPNSTSLSDKSWYGMLYSEIGFTEINLAENEEASRRFPISMVRAGRVSYEATGLGNRSAGAYATKDPYKAANFNLGGESLEINSFVYSEYGLSIRCVKK